jgi:hydroxymethylpyrimidine/phosphomethylpyrimidine kinase
VHVALTIAGSDPSGGAGVQADLKVFHQFGVYGEAVITLITVQNSVRLSRVHHLDSDLVAEQIVAVTEDIPPRAAKTGALGNRPIIEAVAKLAARFTFPLVVDPVMVSKQGAALLDPGAVQCFRDHLLPWATLVTPNLPEAAELAGIQVRDLVTMREAAKRIAGLGAKAVLVKGGHLAGRAIDLLFSDGEFLEFPGERVDTPHTHGTGCAYSAAITAGLAKGETLTEAVAAAKRYIDAAIRDNPGLGHGRGPVNHFASPA